VEKVNADGKPKFGVINTNEINNVTVAVILRKQESRNMLKRLDSRLRGNDKNRRLCQLI
jgi:hypothetical protein